MPTYQYACTECGEKLEAFQSFSDPALTECPTCQGKLRKVFNSVGIVFKGSGFYRNDSRPGQAGAEKPADAAASTSTPASSSSSSSSEGGGSKSGDGSSAGGSSSSGSSGSSGSSSSSSSSSSSGSAASSSSPKPAATAS